MLIVRLKTETNLEVFHHTFGIDLGAPCEDLNVNLRSFDTLKISSQEVIWSLRLLDIETLSCDGGKNMIRLIMYNNQAIGVAGHIRIVVSFITHPDVASCRKRDQTKGC